MKLVTCTLVGGLGNQMFRVAAAIACSLDYGYTAVFPPECQIVLGRSKNYTNSVLRNIHRQVVKEDVII